MNHSTLSPSSLQLLLMVSMLGLTACGGGGGGGSSTPSYTVTATSDANGTISPASTTVTEGDTTSFTVTPNTAYVIGTVSGCGGSLSGTTYTTGAITADCSVTASFQPVTLSVSDVSVMEGDTGSALMTFTVSLSTPANGNVTVDYAISDGTATLADNDYSSIGASGTLTINSATTSTTLSISAFGDTAVESNENVVLTLSNPSANAILGNATAYGIITNDDFWRGPINDTGLTGCYNGTTATTCPVSSAPGQDAEYGRDANAATNTATDGHAGFNFTKLDSTGTALTNQAVAYATTPWSCVLDNNTKLMWEVKTTSGLHNKNTKYYWYDSNPATNGGDAGQTGTATNPDTETFVASVNTEALCGYSDWRMPTVKELMSIANHNTTSVDSSYFPNVVTGRMIWYWTGTTDTSTSDNIWAWQVKSSQGSYTSHAPKNSTYYVRLVRGGQ